MRVLVTGIEGRLAQLVAGVLANTPQHEVSVTGSTAAVLPGFRLVGPLPRGNALSDLLHTTRPDLIIHLDQPGEEQFGARGNAIHTIDLLRAAAAAGVERVILRSSTLIYGADPAQPVVHREQDPPVAHARPDLIRDYVAIEQAAATFAGQITQLSIMRCAPLIAADQIASPFAAYLSQPRPFSMQGFNPRLQLLHLDDAVIGFALAALNPGGGIFNLAADGTVLLEQAIRLVGKRHLALPEAAFSDLALTRPLLGPIRASLPFDPAFLKYSCIADTSRAKQLLGWQPDHDAQATIGMLRAR
jgi:UDP-glucose 4-epimerase